MKRPPTWFVVAGLTLFAISVSAAYAGNVFTQRAPHALFGALSGFCVCGVWFLGMFWQAFDDSWLAYWMADTGTFLGMTLSGGIFMFGLDWPVIAAAVLMAPVAGGAALMRATLWSTR